LSQLGAQALEAIELMLRSVERAGGRGLSRLADDALYDGLLRVVLGFVALDAAEQRGMLPPSPEAGDGSEWERLLLRWRSVYDGADGLPRHQARLFDAGANPLCRAGAPVDDATLSRVAALLGTLQRDDQRVDHRTLPLETLGQLYEQLIGYRIERAEGCRRIARGGARKRSGSFFTPRALAAKLAEAALAPLRERLERVDPGDRAAVIRGFRLCDPAMGAGVFLMEACRRLAALLSPADAVPEREAMRSVALECLYGVDRSELAAAVAELSLWLLVGDPGTPVVGIARHLAVGDSLLGAVGPTSRRAADRELSAELLDDPSTPASSFGGGRFLHFALEFPDAESGFDVVIGNPPWVAFAGRAAQPLDPRLRRYFRKAFRAMHGYPTLHGLFVERAAELAPHGVVALLVPSPIADLDGYKAVRRTLTASHRPREPLLELGQDAFESVVQPCFVLVAEPDPGAQADDRPWRLAERQRVGGAAEAVRVPELLSLLARAPSLPSMAFREMGFQSSRIASRELMLRAPCPDQRHRYPLLEGRDVSEFSEGPPRLYLCVEPEELARARCRVRQEQDYQAARFVVRQTAKVPIAALHSGLPFRNSLLAGLEVEGFSAELLVALLNSALYRALHLSTRRDARQAAFPQVKLAHLRALPRPPDDTALHARLAGMTRRATHGGMAPALRRELDDAVFDLFAVPADHRREVRAFLAVRAKRLGYFVEGPDARLSTPLDAVRERLGVAT